MENFDSIKEELLKIVGEKNIQAAQSAIMRHESHMIEGNIVVGFNDELRHLMDILVQGEMQPSLQIIPSYCGDRRQCLRKFNNHMHRDDELGERVRDTLRGRRYLIVVDDIWDMDAWDKMRSLFPDDKNGSRVILTTRQPIVADYAQSLFDCLYMCLLNDDESWYLLAGKVLGYDRCPPELVETGKRISQCAKGLLVRNLLFASRWDPTGKVEAIGIHDVFWKFCCKKAYEENFMWCKDLEVQNTPEDEEKIRRVSIHSLYQDSDWMELYWARSLLCVGSVSQDLAPIFLRLRLLRVLDILQFVSAEFLEEMLQMFNLRYLALTCHSHIPSSISFFQHLQTLVEPGASSLPSELWEMKQLRHIKCKQTRTWPAVEEHEDSSAVVQENLQTLSNVPSSVISEEFLRKFPNIRKLQIFFPDALMHTSVCLHRLTMLENLKCSFDGSPQTRNVLPYLQFPVSLKKVTLISCVTHSGDLHMLWCLRNLEQLKLHKCDFMDGVWEQIEDESLLLKVLHLEDSNLVHWIADDSYFPCIEQLIIRGCHSMQEIPSEIGYVPTLKLIEVDDCGPLLVSSALSILEEQQNLGNVRLRVSITNTRTA